MKKHLMIATLIAIPLGLSACDNPAEAPKTQSSTDQMGDMAMSGEVKNANGIGIVTAVDADGGKITLDHEAIPSVGWPAMTMGFSVNSELLKSVAVGDKVEFDISVHGNAAQVTAIGKR
ncbi:MAG: copper-binding protein [Parasphingorhabdus sp.]